MADLARERCRNHPNREAVARCPECGHFFCRECVTEHDNRMLCNACLLRTTLGDKPASSRWRKRLGLMVFGCLGFLLLWGAFYLIGQGLLAIPSSFHEGTIWRSPWWDAQ
jgi:hypothetical protein